MYKKIVNKNVDERNRIDSVGLVSDFLDILYEKDKRCGDISYSAGVRSFNKNINGDETKIANTLIRSYKRFYENDRELNKMIKNEVKTLMKNVRLL